jgi:uncharacterized membrane protein
MIGATPLDAKAEAESCATHAESTARIAGLSADHANSGLRTYYFAIAGIGWFLHPLLFLLATTWVLIIMIRRDFFSRSRRAMLGALEAAVPVRSGVAERK